MPQRSNNMKNAINQNICKKCRLCIEVCPVNMIGLDQNDLVNFIPERENICLECGQCMAVCATDAIKIAKYTYADNFLKRPENIVDYQRFIDFIANRRSVRNFKKKPIEKQLIEQILISLDYAPYGAAPDKVEVTVVNNRDIIERALPMTERFLDNIIKWIESPLVSRLIQYKKGIETYSTLKNHLYPMSKLENYKLKFGDKITRGAPALLILHADKAAEEHTDNALIYATYLMLAIHALGLGGTMNGIMPAAINKDAQIRHIFNIPQNHEAIISIMFGYPKYKYVKTVKREHKRTHWLE